MWDYLESTWTLASDLVGYVVEVADGRAGHDERMVSIDVTRAQLAAAPAYGDHRLDDAVRAEHDRYFRTLFGR